MNESKSASSEDCTCDIDTVCRVHGGPAATSPPTLRDSCATVDWTWETVEQLLGVSHYATQAVADAHNEALERLRRLVEFHREAHEITRQQLLAAEAAIEKHNATIRPRTTRETCYVIKLGEPQRGWCTPQQRCGLDACPICEAIKGNAAQ
jgi:hypothetical protein